MITKSEDKRNKYYLDSTSSTEDLNYIYQQYKHVRCIICNMKTSERFYKPWDGSTPVTINNTIDDNVFYINSVC